MFTRHLKPLIICSVSLLILLKESSAHPSRFELYQEHLDTMKTGMSILGVWSVSNLVLGTISRQRSTGKSRYFHEMNAGWNLINLGIASLGYITLTDPNGWSSLEGLRELESTDRILLFNAGLDLAYIALGYGLIERGQRLGSDRFIGYGRSLLLQGGFLFVFDSLFAYLHSDLTDQLRINLHAGLTGLTFTLPF
jgi:hypothetical protein